MDDVSILLHTTILPLFWSLSSRYYTIAGTKNKGHSRRQAKYNEEHSFVWGHGEHPFAQLYIWCVCMNFEMHWEEHILRLHWVVHVVVHIQQFIKKCNIKCSPMVHGGYFLCGIFGTKPCAIDGDSPICNPDSASESNGVNRLTCMEVFCSLSLAVYTEATYTNLTAYAVHLQHDVSTLYGEGVCYASLGSPESFLKSPIFRKK